MQEEWHFDSYRDMQICQKARYIQISATCCIICLAKPCRLGGTPFNLIGDGEDVRIQLSSSSSSSTIKEFTGGILIDPIRNSRDIYKISHIRFWFIDPQDYRYSHSSLGLHSNRLVSAQMMAMILEERGARLSFFAYSPY